MNINVYKLVDLCEASCHGSDTSIPVTFSDVTTGIRYLCCLPWDGKPQG
jgi:hypothetical protein